MSAHLDPELFRSVLDSLQTGVYVVDRDGKILFWNEGAERISGYQRHAVVGHNCRETVLAGCTGKECELCGDRCPLSSTLQEGKAKESHIYFRHKDGHRVPVCVWSAPVRDDRGTVIAIAQSFHETQGSINPAHSQPRAGHGCMDEFTGVPNRSFSEFHLRENFASFKEYMLPFAIVIVQVDQLDRFRSAYGRESVSGALSVVVETIKACIRPTDFLGRWAEDRFLVIAVNCTGSGLDKVVERLGRATGHAEIKWWGDSLRIDTSLGQAAIQTGDTIELLLERAEKPLEQTVAVRTTTPTNQGTAKD